MVENAYISTVFFELKSRCNRISVVVNRQRLKRQLNTSCPDIEYMLNTTLPPTLDEAQVAFINYNCAIFTAFRGGFTLEENIERNNKLRADMDQLGLNYRPVDGCYKEAEMEHVVKEYCFFVVKRENVSAEEFFTHAYRLSEKYEQDCFLYKRSGFQKTAFLVATTDSGRQDLCGDIRFAGQFFEYVYDVGAWTACSDGRFAFVQKGMFKINTNNKKIKIGEGSVFDIEGYRPDGLVVIHKIEPEGQQYFKDGYLANKDKLPVIHHTFIKESQTETAIRTEVITALNELKKQRCKRIGIHCSASVNGSTVEAAKIAYNTITQWVSRNDRKIDCIVIVDTYGDYCKI